MACVWKSDKSKVQSPKSKVTRIGTAALRAAARAISVWHPVKINVSSNSNALRLGEPRSARLWTLDFGLWTLPTLLLLGFLASTPLRAADSGASVVVIYNSKMPESKEVADYYAQRREVPASQVFGFDLPVTEAMTRKEYLEQLQTPLLKKLEANKLFTFQTAGSAEEGKSPDKTLRRLADSSIRYAVLCYGVPTKILRDTNFVELEAAKLPAELRRNEAAVDSQLACAPPSAQKRIWAGPLPSPYYLVTNASELQPTNGILIVARLDGPSAAIARGLVDKAMEAETNGLWGRAYFDARGLTNGEYELGDEWIRAAASIARRRGFETELDQNPNTFPASFPMSQVALYAGWYDGVVSGPFTRPTVEFMPGAFAYHLHSFSAQTLRSTNQNWVGPLLNKGATITLGCVDEPYLTGTPNIAAFMERFLLGFSFGEAAYAAQNWLSWQTTVVGDPLYRPFGRRPESELHFDLQKRRNKLVEWSHLTIIGRNQAIGTDVDELIDYLDKLPLTRHSAVLEEKLADLYWGKHKFSDAFDTYEQVLKLGPSPQQRVRVLLQLAQRRSIYGTDQAACETYEKLLREAPDYPDPLSIYQKLLPLAEKLGKKEQVERCQQEIKRLSPQGQGH